METAHHPKQASPEDGGTLREIPPHSYDENLPERVARNHHEKQPQQDQKRCAATHRDIDLEDPGRLREVDKEPRGCPRKETDRAKERERRP